MEKRIQGFYTWNLLIEQKNNNDQRKAELKESAQKKRKERFDPENNKPMAEQIIERKKQLEKEVDEAVSLAVPVPAANRMSLCIQLISRSQIAG